MRERDRKSIEIDKMLPQFTTMNVIEGQAGLVNYSSLIFYSLTLNNILNIIVLLILAGVTIATLTGENGILSRATDAKDQTEIGNEKEKVELSAVGALAKDNGGEIKRNYLNDELTSYIGTEETDYTLSESETAPFVVTYLDSGRSYIIDENGSVSEYIDISKYVGLGDYVNYNPTVSDKSGTQVEATKLTYTSPKGTGMSHGNGSSDQTFTATADTKWRVLDIGSGTVTLISENPITTDTGENFTMIGTIGYLYAEQELQEICKIYGYGYGTNENKGGTYTIGGPFDTLKTQKIEGTGARSITIEDINEKAGITEDDYITLNSSYGNTTNPTIDIYYPTINTVTGRSDSKGGKNNLKYTVYTYNKSQIKDTNVQNILFNGNYWLSSRAITTNVNDSDFIIYSVISSLGLLAGRTCNGHDSGMYEYTYPTAIRPVVSIESNVIDISSSTEYNGETMWNLK